MCILYHKLTTLSSAYCKKVNIFLKTQAAICIRANISLWYALQPICRSFYIIIIIFPTQPHFPIPPTAIFDKSIFCEFTLFFPMTFNPPTEKSEKAVSRTLNRVLDLVVKNQSVQIGCQMCCVCLLGLSPVSAYRKKSVHGNISKKVKCRFSALIRHFTLFLLTAELRTQRASKRRI